MRLTITAVSAAVVVASSASSHFVDARSGGIFGVNGNSNALFGRRSSSTAGIGSSDEKLNNVVLSSSLSVRGGSDEGAADDEAQAEPETLYLPGLLTASVSGKGRRSTASADYTASISPGKARELGVKSGDVVAIIGRRRRASYAKIAVSKMSSDGVKLAWNLGANLRVRDAEQVKVVPIGGDGEDDEGAYGSGDMALCATRPSVAAGVTLSPVKDSLYNLELSEGGDEIGESEIMDRFVGPYLNLDEDVAIAKVGHTLTLMDDNGKSLEFTVTHLDMVGGESDMDSDVEDEAGEG